MVKISSLERLFVLNSLPSKIPFMMEVSGSVGHYVLVL